jgi:outer membrane receptor for ferric coprogen and ferric-rhodotorulic acid
MSHPSLTVLPSFAPRFRLHRLALACALVVAGSAPAMAAAPEAEDAADAPVPTVTVTGANEKPGYTVRDSSSATRFDLSLRDTPQSVTVVTRQKMDDFKLNSINDMLASTPGVSVEAVETDRIYYTARGFDITNFQYDGVGVPFVFGNVTGNFDTALYEQVDIVRGANGLMSSTGNPSATVNFVRKRPGKELAASSTLTFGSWGNKRLDVDVSVPLSDKWAARAVLARDQGDSWLDRYHLNKTVASAIVEGKLTRDDKLAFGYTYQKSAATGAMYGALPLYYADGSPTSYAGSASTGADWAFSDAEVHSGFAEWTHAFDNGWSSKVTATYNVAPSRWQMLFVSGAQDPVTGLGLSSYTSLYNSDFKQKMVDAQVSGKFALAGRSHDVSLGGAWTDSRISSNSSMGPDTGTALPGNTAVDGSYPKPDFPPALDNGGYSDKRKNAYVAVRWNLADDVKLLTGANHTKVDTNGVSYGVSSARAATKTTPYAGLVYTINPVLSAYGSYTSIFNAQSEIDINRQTLAPVEGKTYELGLKSELFGGKANLSGAIFRTKQSNAAQQIGYINGIDAYYEGIKAESQGFEAEFSGQLARNWDASIGLSVLSIEGDDGAAARTYIPRRTFKAATTYRLDAMPALKVGASVNLQSKIHTEENGATINQGGYTTVGLMAQYAISPKLLLAANVNNVTDKRYLSSLFWTQSFYAAPRNASVSLTWKY